MFIVHFYLTYECFKYTLKTTLLGITSSCIREYFDVVCPAIWNFKPFRFYFLLETFLNTILLVSSAICFLLI